MSPQRKRALEHALLALDFSRNGAKAGVAALVALQDAGEIESEEHLAADSHELDGADLAEMLFTVADLIRQSTEILGSEGHADET